MRRGASLRHAMLAVVAAALLACVPPAAAGPPAANAAPQRIVSLNLCLDQLLLDLVPRERIVSVTHLALDPLYSPRAAEFAGIAPNHGLAEEVLSFEPDLVLTSPFSRPTTTALLRRLGYRVVEVPVAATLAEMRRQIVALAAEVGAEPRAAAMLRRMDERLAALPPVPAVPPSAMIYDTNGVTGGAGTLVDEVLTLAGFENRARTLGIDGWRRLDLETMLVGDPDFLVTDDLDTLPPSLGRALVTHPALDAQQARRIELSGNLWVCPGPAVLTAIETLAAARLAAAAGTGPATPPPAARMAAHDTAAPGAATP